MTRQTILVVDDDARVRKLLRGVLESEGFEVLQADTAAAVLDLVKTAHITLITLDVQLGQDNGIELAREIRKLSPVPIIMVSGRGDVIDRVVGLEVGADDYITKPFHVREVIARIRSVVRRSAMTRDAALADTSESKQPVLPDKSIHFRFDEMIAVPDRLELIDRAGEECDLTSGDFKLLTIFLERPKRVLSRDQLMDLTGGRAWSPLDRTIDNQIARLRKKIERDAAEPKLIKTVRGLGYTFACDVEIIAPSDVTAKRA